MKTKLYFVLAFQLLSTVALAQLSVQQLRTENLTDPVGIDVKVPRFSWQINGGNKRGILQTAYEIQVEDLNGKTVDNVWSSSKVKSDQSLYISYAGKALQSGHRYNWRVRVWDNTGKASKWSERSYYQMGFLSLNDWKAKWIGPGYAGDSINKPSPIFRKEVTLTKTIKKATAYITSHGLYEAQLNGAKIGNAHLTPGWTSYQTRLQYQVYDVTNMLTKGKNAIAAKVGSGWYRTKLAPSNPNKYGKDVGLLFQLEITYTDGSSQTIVSDESWKSSTGELRFAEIYDGAIIDARLEPTGWNKAGFDDGKWPAARVQNYSKENLIASSSETVQKHETFKVAKILTTPKGEHVIDFGQNLVGWVKLKVKGKSGDSIKLSHAEVLDKAGNFYIENLREAKAQDIYILKGSGAEVFEPQFTWQGFRYVKVEGISGNLNPEDFTAVVLYSDMRPTGTFTTSNPLINQLQHNIQWGQKGNFLDVPTDCPQRDERLGWTGDAQVFSRTASYNMDVYNFFRKWMKDVSADQYKSGSIPYVIPDVLKYGNNEVGGSAGWGDVATILPWNMYLAYGDKEILQNQYPGMKAWVEFMRSQSSNDLWNKGNHFGDWLFYSIDNDLDGSSAITGKYLIAQCFYAHSTQLLINAAKVLGNSKDEAEYTALLGKIKNAFMQEYVTPSGLISADTQTAYALALEFDLLPENLREQAAGRLARNIGRYGNHLTTGFLGTPYLCHALSRFGYADVAYKLLLQERYPSWLYPVKMGATTIWERWNGIHPDGTFEPASMNSYNHYAYGAIGDWMYRVVAGIDTETDGPGYKKITLKPEIGGNFSYANADYETLYGKLTANWKIDGSTIHMDILIPANTTATIYVPGDPASVLEGGKSINGKDIVRGKDIPGFTAFKVGSGDYHFSTQKTK